MAPPGPTTVWRIGTASERPTWIKARPPSTVCTICAALSPRTLFGVPYRSHRHCCAGCYPEQPARRPRHRVRYPPPDDSARIRIIRRRDGLSIAARGPLDLIAVARRGLEEQLVIHAAQVPPGSTNGNKAGNTSSTVLLRNWIISTAGRRNETDPEGQHRSHQPLTLVSSATPHSGGICGKARYSLEFISVRPAHRPLEFAGLRALGVADPRQRNQRWQSA